MRQWLGPPWCLQHYMLPELSLTPSTTFQTYFSGNGEEFTDKRHVFGGPHAPIQMYLHIIFVITPTSDLSHCIQCPVYFCVPVICIIYLFWRGSEKKPEPVIIEPSLKRSVFIEYMRFYNFCLKAPQLSIKYQN